MAAGTAGSARVNDEVVDALLEVAVPLHPPTRINPKDANTTQMLFL
jgi:hypothetical protein